MTVYDSQFSRFQPEARCESAVSGFHLLMTAYDDQQKHQPGFNNANAQSEACCD